MLYDEISSYICTANIITTLQMETNIVNLPDFKIEVSSKHKKMLAKEFSCTVQHIRQILNYQVNSQLGFRVRARTKELLLVEIEKINNIKVSI